jgi:deoxycytidylate deaminase
MSENNDNQSHPTVSKQASFNGDCMDQLFYSTAPIVIGLVGRMGNDFAKIKNYFTNYFTRFKYSYDEKQYIKISKKFLEDEKTPAKNLSFERKEYLICKGNRLRKFVSRLFKDTANKKIISDGFLGLKTAVEIINNNSSNQKTKFYIIDSLKRPEEIQLLRLAFPSSFFAVGVYREKDDLKAFLKPEMANGEIEKLLERDEHEQDDDHGQRTRKAFEECDYFLDDSQNTVVAIDKQIKRLVKLLLGHPSITPTFDEYAMYLAFSSSLRSGALARQVGAVLADEKHNEILGLGANDVPKFGGGLYWPILTGGDIKEPAHGRDLVFEFPENSGRVGDSNDFMKIDMINEFEKSLKENIKNNDLTKKMTSKMLKKAIKKSGLNDITEYGRMLHAEMEMLISCARKGQSTRDTTCYVTTFPCHNCTKHLIAAGIKRIVYIESYPKSKAFDLHYDSIVLRGDANSENKVLFEPYIGAGPRLFYAFFSMNHEGEADLKRKTEDRKDDGKDDGKIKQWPSSDSPPKPRFRGISGLNLPAKKIDAILSDFQRYQQRVNSRVERLKTRRLRAQLDSD